MSIACAMLLISIWKLTTTSASRFDREGSCHAPLYALYARYSSDNQFDTSIEDQLQQCRARAERKGGRVAES